MHEDTVTHVYQPQPVRFNLKVEKNSRGYNWELTVLSADSVEQALELARSGRAQLERTFGEPVSIGVAS